MPQIDFSKRTVSCKVVYFGPEGCGKSTNLKYIHANAIGNSIIEGTTAQNERGQPVYSYRFGPQVPNVAGMQTSFIFSSCRSHDDLTVTSALQGCDGIVFIVDSRPEMMSANIEVFEQMARCLNFDDTDILNIPLVLQFNKLDLPQALPSAELSSIFNVNNWDVFEAVASNGTGVLSTLDTIVRRVITSPRNIQDGPNFPRRSTQPKVMLFKAASRPPPPPPSSIQ